MIVEADSQSRILIELKLLETPPPPPNAAKYHKIPFWFLGGGGAFFLADCASVGCESGVCACPWSELYVDPRAQALTH